MAWSGWPKIRRNPSNLYGFLAAQPIYQTGPNLSRSATHPKPCALGVTEKPLRREFDNHMTPGPIAFGSCLGRIFHAFMCSFFCAPVLVGAEFAAVPHRRRSAGPPPGPRGATGRFRFRGDPGGGFASPDLIHWLI